MLKKLFRAAALVMLAVLLLQNALAEENNAFDIFMGSFEDTSSLRDYIEDLDGPLYIAGSPINKDQFIILDDGTVGEKLEQRIGRAAKNVMILDENTLPPGCSTEIRNEKENKNDKNAKKEDFLYLVGTPKKEGNYYFILWNDTVQLCVISIRSSRDASAPDSPSGSFPQPAPDSSSGSSQQPAPDPLFDGSSGYFGDWVPETEPPAVTQAPKVSAPELEVHITGDTRCRPGEPVVLEARVTGNEGAALQYQWYSSVGSAQGPIVGATESTFAPDTSVPGICSFYCSVSCRIDGFLVTGTSEAMTLSVLEPPVSSVEIESLPGKTDYRVGDTVDTSGLRLLVTLADGSRQLVSDGFTVSPTVLNSAGTQTVLVSYRDTGCSFTVTVEEDLRITGIAVESMPNKTSYKVGDRLDTTGLGIRVYTNRGSQTIYTGFEVSPGYLQQAGTQTVTVRYGGQACTFTVSVEEELVITGIAAANLPTKTSYKVGDRLDTAGLGIRVYTNKGSQTVYSGFEVSPSYLQQAGTQTVTVRYGGKTCSFTVSVEEDLYVTGIALASLPTKTSYRVGDRLDTSGLGIRVYTNKGNQTVYSGFEISPSYLQQAGTQTVTVRYGDRTCSFTVSVEGNQDQGQGITGIAVASLPARTSYKVGERLDTSGLVIRVFSRSGSTDITSGFDVSPTYLQQAGEQTITVRYSGRTCTFYVTVKEDVYVTGIAIESQPVNRSYMVGDTINTTGLTLRVYTNQGSQAISTGFSWSPKVVSSPGTQQITVTYGEHSAVYTVNVSAPATPSPSPSPAGFPTPSPSAAAASQSTPGPTVSPSPAPQVPQPAASVRRSSGVNTVVKLLFVVALLSLLGLIGFILYMRRQDREEDEEEAQEKAPMPRRKPSARDQDVYDMFSGKHVNGKKK